MGKAGRFWEAQYDSLCEELVQVDRNYADLLGKHDDKWRKLVELTLDHRTLEDRFARLHARNAQLEMTCNNAYEAGRRFAEVAHANEVAELKATIARGALDQ